MYISISIEKKIKEFQKHYYFERVNEKKGK